MQTEHLSLKDVLDIHDHQIQVYGGTTGYYGDTNAKLESALAQPGAVLYGQVIHPDVAEQAAAYLFYLVKAHAFVDGNKRTAWGSMVAFLKLNGFQLAMSTAAAEKLVYDVVNGVIDKAAAAVVIHEHLIC